MLLSEIKYHETFEVNGKRYKRVAGTSFVETTATRRDGKILVHVWRRPKQQEWMPDNLEVRLTYSGIRAVEPAR